VKYASVVRDDEGVLRFQSTGVRPGHARCYDVESRAVCQAGREHRPPAWRCWCGFYATHDLPTLLDIWQREHVERSTVLLEVQLSGRVVEHRSGWRAARQVVLAALWNRRCAQCGEDASGFTLPGRTGRPVVQVCAKCDPGAVSPSTLAGHLGTEVGLREGTLPDHVWTPPPPVHRHRWSRVIRVQVLATTTALCGVGALAFATHSRVPNVTRCTAGSPPIVVPPDDGSFPAADCGP
jgi:hypothetical protein